MKSSHAAALIALFSVATALPQLDLVKRADPDDVPVTFDQMTTTDYTCGSTQYSPNDIYQAAQWGVLLTDSDPPQFRGKKSGQFPNGRFPHSFTDNSNHDFLPNCPDGDDSRTEYPLVPNGPYNGGISNNNKWGPDRVVYMYEPGEVDDDGHAKGTFCGVMTHTGASPAGTFVMCTAAVVAIP